MSEPVMISIPAGAFSETDLMAALEAVINSFRASNDFRDPEWRYSEARAADWVKAKFGSQ